MKARPILEISLVFLVAVFVSACAKETARADLRGRFLSKAVSIKAYGRIELDSGGEERRTDAAIVISLPSSVRVDAMDELADVWAMAGSDGTQMWLYLPARQKMYRASASKKNLNRLMDFDWELPELVFILAGQPPSGALFEGRNIRVWMDKKGRRVVKCARYNADETAMDYVVNFSDYKMVGDIAIPHRIEALVPGRQTRLLVEYSEVQTTPAVDDSVFFPPARRKGKIMIVDDNNNK